MVAGKERDAGRSAGKVLWHVTMSLDGFIAGRDDAMDWLSMDWLSGHSSSSHGEEVIQTTGAILAGRRWYDLAMTRFGGLAGIYGGKWTGPVLVLTHRPTDAADDPAITFLSDGIRGAVATALAAAEGKNVVLFGANIPQQCLVEGLVDEIVIHLAPLLLGDGIRLFGGPGTDRVHLERLSLAPSGQLTDFRFRVLK
jgi:dihydrofolate reductase